MKPSKYLPLNSGLKLSGRSTPVIIAFNYHFNRNLIKNITRSKTVLVFPRLIMRRVMKLAGITLLLLFTLLTIVQRTINLHYCEFDNSKID